MKARSNRCDREMRSELRNGTLVAGHNKFHTSGGARVAYRKCQELTLLKPSKWQPWTPNELQGRILKANGGLRRQTVQGRILGLLRAAKRQPWTPVKEQKALATGAEELRRRIGTL